MAAVDKSIEDLSLFEIDLVIALVLNRFIVTVHTVDDKSCCKIAVNEEYNSFPFRPTTEPRDAIPLAEEFKVGVAWDATKQVWVSHCHNVKDFFAQHKEMMPAQMLAILKAYKGSIVRVPLLS